MKVSLNTVKWFLDFELPSVDKLVDKIGAQLGAVDEIIDFGSRYDGIALVKVVACEKLANTDKLSICRIDDGGFAKDVQRDKDGYIQVVCGAPNVHAGMTAVWIPPGVIVPETVDKEPFVLEAREIRGVISNGMLASVKELALGDNHAGILEFEGDQHKPGTDFAYAIGLKDDVVIDIENKMFTHRPDCFGFVGIARELAGIYQKPFKSPEWYVVDPKFPAMEGEELKLTVKNELPELVPRFTAIVLSDVQVGASPLWLQTYLALVGQKSINNIVDYTNFYMMETGQPLHAYDYDKVAKLSNDGTAIVVRQPHKGEKLKLLNGKEIEPAEQAVIIATDKQAIGLGGVMGGSETEVDENTMNIILEAATFDMYSIRRTSMGHGLFTDAVTRFSKGQSPLQALTALAKITDEIRAHAGGKVAGPVIDDNHLSDTDRKRNSLYPPVKVTDAFINSRLGLDLKAADMKKLLENVEFEVEVSGDELIVKAPFWRTDIELREDVVEEVGRLYGYDHLPLELPQRGIAPTRRDQLTDFKSVIRERLSKAGANEVLTYSFVPGDLLDKTGQDKAKAFQVANALSPDLQYYRISLMPSLLEKVHPNVKAGYDSFALFEIGKTHDTDHIDDQGLPIEFEFTGLVVTAADKLKLPGAAYYQAQKYLRTLVGVDLSFRSVGDDMKHYPVVQPYDLNRAAMVSVKGGHFLGIIGEFKPSVARNLKLPRHTAGFEIDTQALAQLVTAGMSYSPLSRFPSVKQDITLGVSDKSYQEVFDFVDKELGANAPEDTHIRLEPIDIYQKDKRHFTFRITITGHNRTLTDKEASAALDAIAEAAKTGLKAERI
jgi:phenylalanyl-tRNA synthetase beta chain